MSSDTSQRRLCFVKAIHKTPLVIRHSRTRGDARVGADANLAHRAAVQAAGEKERLRRAEGRHRLP